MTHHVRNSCRVCDGERLTRFLSLGPMPLANAFLASPEEFAAEKKYPLDVYFCEDCGLVQLCDVISPSVLFQNYIYVKATSETVAAHNEQYARTVRELLDLRAEDLVVEVASNDGSLLHCFQPFGVRTLGVEPAANIADLAREASVETVTRFFDAKLADELRDEHGAARAVIANNVLAHVDDPRDFLTGCQRLLADDGVVLIEVPYLQDLVEQLEFDTIYHEHLCYFSAAALLRLFAAAELSVFRIDRIPLHGGSLRVYAAPRQRRPDHAEDVARYIAAENGEGLNELETYQRFARRVDDCRSRLRELLGKLHVDGRTIAGYGAPAKGTTLLNYCGVTNDVLAYTVDRSSLKVGLYTPGVHVPVLPVETLLDRQPDHLLILAWNFADEIMRQQREYQSRGGRFVLPLPEPRIV